MQSNFPNIHHQPQAGQQQKTAKNTVQCIQDCAGSTGVPQNLICAGIQDTIKGVWRKMDDENG